MISLETKLFFADLMLDDIDKVVTLNFIDGPSDVCEVTLTKDRIAYTLSSIHHIQEPAPDSSIHFLAIRAIGTHPLFVSARRAGLRGTVRLWLDDRPRGPGLAFSGPASANLIPDPEFLFGLGYREFRARTYPSWQERNRRIFWRGFATGHDHYSVPWLVLPRTALCLTVKDDPNFDVKISGADYPVLFKDAGIFQPRVEPEKFSEYRHVIDIDGSSSSWSGLFHKLLFGCTILKIVSDQYQWYYDRLIPWKNYVPVSSINELREIGRWVLSHETDCERIATAGQNLAQSLTWNVAMEAGVTAIARELTQL